MGNVNNYVLGICFSVIFCIIFEIFTPSERYKDIIKIVSGIFVLYTLMTPLKGLISPEGYELKKVFLSYADSNLYKNYEEKANEVFNELLIEKSEENIEKDIGNFFDEPDVDIMIDKNDFEIFVSGLRKTESEKVYAYLKNRYNIKPPDEE